MVPPTFEGIMHIVIPIVCRYKGIMIRNITEKVLVQLILLFINKSTSWCKTFIQQNVKH